MDSFQTSSTAIRAIAEAGLPPFKATRLISTAAVQITNHCAVDVNLDELDQVLDGARQAPLSETDYDKLKGALHALAAMLVRPSHTEKTSAVLEESGGSETG